MARIPVSGYNDEALTVPATDVREIVAPAYDLDGRSRVFWLRSVVIANEHATDPAVVEIYDQDEGAATATAQRLTLICPANSTTLYDFPEPGVKFTVNVCAATTGGTVNAYGVTTMGYEE